MTTEAYNAGITEADFNEVMDAIQEPEKNARYIVKSADRLGNVIDIPVFGTKSEAFHVGQRYGCKTVSVDLASDEQWGDHMREAEYANQSVISEEGC